MAITRSIAAAIPHDVQRALVLDHCNSAGRTLAIGKIESVGPTLGRGHLLVHHTVCLGRHSSYPYCVDIAAIIHRHRGVIRSQRNMVIQECLICVPARDHSIASVVNRAIDAPGHKDIPLSIATNGRLLELVC
jgi:hypothetical protein